jgi:O-antigen/teichoic acid export membrane protein
MEKKNAAGKYDKLFDWIKLISVTGGAQVVVQLAGLVTGIAIVRLLPVKEYAFYTLANTVMGIMTILTDGGISTGVMSKGGKVWQDKNELGVVLVTGLKLRKKFAVFSLLVSIPVLFFLLLKQGISFLNVSLIALTLIPSFWAALSDSLLEIVPKLHQDIKPLQKNQVIVGLIRLVLSVGLLFIFPFTFIALLANGIPRIIGNIKLRSIAGRFADFQQSEDLKVRDDIIKIVRRVMPGAIYFCLSGQITIWLLSILGSTVSVAQIGALGRISMLFTLFTILFNTLIIPRFARLHDRGTMVRFFAFSQLTTYVILSGLVFLVWLFSHQILLLLGNDYLGLGRELTILIVANSINLISGLFFGIASSRGWIINPVLLIASNIVSVIAGAILFKVSTLIGAVWFNLFTSLVPFVVNGGFIYYKLFSKRSQF